MMSRRSVSMNQMQFPTLKTDNSKALLEFEQLDLDGDGKIDSNEVRRLLKGFQRRGSKMHEKIA